MSDASQTKPVRVVILDDHPAMVRGIQEFLEDATGFEVVGTAENVEQFLRVVGEHEPDIALVDLVLPGPNQPAQPFGVEAIRQARALPRPPRCIVYTAFPKYEREASLAGAAAFVEKDATMDDLVKIIRQVLELKPDQSIVRPVVIEGPQKEPLADTGERLTPRELVVFGAWVVDPNAKRKEVARRLDTSEGTLRTQLHNIYRKLGIQSRAEAVLKAQAMGIRG